MAIVLVVDDEFGIATLLKDVFEDEGHRVLTATNGKQALERAREERPDLVISDFMMPVMDGAALLEALAADPAFNTIPVVIMSSMSEVTLAERCSGFAFFVRKPFRIYDLIEAVAPLLDPVR